MCMYVYIYIYIYHRLTYTHNLTKMNRTAIYKNKVLQQIQNVLPDRSKEK